MQRTSRRSRGSRGTHGNRPHYPHFPNEEAWNQSIRLRLNLTFSNATPTINSSSSDQVVMWLTSSSKRPRPVINTFDSRSARNFQLPENKSDKPSLHLARRLP